MSAPKSSAPGEERAQAGPATILPFVAGADNAAFRSLNEEWITHHFTLEPKDIETLQNPESAILRKGGAIFMAHALGTPVGCVALIPMGGGVFELSKMAVDVQMRGQGLGRRLLLHAIEEARRLGASSLFLGSSTKLPDAVHLYESVGFRHLEPGERPDLAYSRANVFMRMAL